MGPSDVAAKGIRAYANCDDAYVVWRYDAAIPACRGFALYKQLHGKDPEPVHTFAPFVGQPKAEGEWQPSTRWPIQKFAWTDVGARSGDVARYRVVPMVGTAADLHELEELASDWTDEISVTAQASGELSAFFNRGVLATQSVARRLAGDEPWRKRLKLMINTPGDSTRNYLSGELRPALLKVLDDAKTAGDIVHAALFELADPELRQRLEALGAQANVVLSNGDKADGDENADARAALRAAGVHVHDRMTGSRLGHNKFLVITAADGKAKRVWTGSTNWTVNGLCTQVNNAVLIDNEDVARYYRAHWDALVAAGNGFPDALVDGDDIRQNANLEHGSIGTWFAPTHNTVDLADARALIAAAGHGILFLMFNPGRRDTLFNAIMDRADPQSEHYDAGLYVHGVLNQDPEAGAKEPALVGLIHRGQLDEADPDIVLPSQVDERFSFWDQEVNRYSLVMVHSKVIVLDPFGETPIVMTGSHNLGPRASSKNDDNLNIISGVSSLAAAYATNIMAVYNAYRWRYVRSQRAQAKGQQWQGPEDNDSWQDSYYSGPDADAKQRELAFWLGEEPA